MKSHSSYQIICLVIFFFLHSFHLNGQEIQEITGLLYTDLKPVSIKIQNGKIFKVKPLKKLPAGIPEHIIAPGFIDNQVNGFAGVSFSFGKSDLNPEGIRKATKALWENGVTTYLPTLTTNSHELLVKNFTILAGAFNDDTILGSIPGFHLEGPYISPEDGYRGAHPRKFVRIPDWNEFEQLNQAAGGKILQVTLAPEVSGAIEFIENCTKKDIIVALGHHNAGKAVVDQAVEAGAKTVTHLGNGCANMINRHENPLWPQLANDNLMISIIADGFHLRPEEIAVFYKVKGADKTIITSDVTHFAALQPGKYITESEEEVELTPEGMLWVPAQKVLYGSASPITKGIGNVLKITGCSLADAVKMASTNPADLYRLSDRGKIESGRRADIVVFSLDNFKLNIRKTIVKGNLVFENK